MVFLCCRSAGKDAVLLRIWSCSLAEVVSAKQSPDVRHAHKHRHNHNMFLFFCIRQQDPNESSLIITRCSSVLDVSVTVVCCTIVATNPLKPIFSHRQLPAHRREGLCWCGWRLGILELTFLDVSMLHSGLAVRSYCTISCHGRHCLTYHHGTILASRGCVHWLRSLWKSTKRSSNQIFHFHISLAVLEVEICSGVCDSAPVECTSSKMDDTRIADTPSFLSHDAATSDLESGLSKKVHAWIWRRVVSRVV